MFSKLAKENNQERPLTYCVVVIPPETLELTYNNNLLLALEIVIFLQTLFKVNSQTLSFTS